MYRPGASPTAVSARALLGLCYSTWLGSSRRASPGSACSSHGLLEWSAAGRQPAPRLDWPRCNALRDGVVSALPDGARAQPQGSAVQASVVTSKKRLVALLLLQKAASRWLVAAPRVDARRRCESAD